MAAHDRLLGEAAHSEGQPLEAVAELGAHDVVQDGVDGLQMRKGTSLFCSVFSHDMTATHHIYLLLVCNCILYVMLMRSSGAVPAARTFTARA